MSNIFDSTQLSSTIKVLHHALLKAESISRDAKQKINVQGQVEVVTLADAACEEFIIQELGLREKDAPTLAAEESSTAHTTLPENYRTLDPVDGTLAFSLNTDRWGVLLGEVRAYQPRFGVALLRAGNFGFSVDVARQEVLFWNHAQGTFISAERPQVITPKIVFPQGYYTADSYERLGEIAEKLQIELAPTASAVEAAATIARGEASMFLCYGGKAWDDLPLAALLQLWGGGAVNVNTGLVHDWRMLTAPLILGYELSTLTTFAKELQKIKLEMLPPRKQWVPSSL